MGRPVTGSRERAIVEYIQTYGESDCARIQGVLFPADEDGRQVRWDVDRLVRAGLLKRKREPTKRLPATYVIGPLLTNANR
jgi:hypothetical protein